MMQQSEALRFLKRDLTIVTSHLHMKDYPQLFEEELQEYFPFNQQILDWLSEIYQSEKYEAFDEDKLSLYYEKKHPFLFVRDLAHMNSWNMGHQEQVLRLNHITGLLFSGNSNLAAEATVCLCRPSRIKKPAGSWFDFKQAMQNLEHLDESEYRFQSLKASALFYFYFHLSDEGTEIVPEDLVDLLEPYKEAIERGRIWGTPDLKKECETLSQVFTPGLLNRTLLDGFSAR